MNRIVTSFTLVLTTLGALLPTIAAAQLVQIEDFINQNLSTKKMTSVFKQDMSGPLYTASHTGEYVAVAATQEITTDTGQPARRPAEIYLVGPDGLVGEFQNEQKTNIFRILPERQWLYLNEIAPSGLSRLTIWDFDGDNLGVIDGKGLLDLSPGGVFAYTMVSMESERPLHILDLEGNLIFKVPRRYEYQVQAVSDSEVVVLEEKTLSLWNISQGEKSWSVDVPREKFYVDTAFKIMYSIESHIIAVRDMYGCYCFDFSGSLLWYREIPTRLQQMVGMGLAQDGVVAFSTVSSSGLEVKTVDKGGTTLQETNCLFGPGIGFSGCWGSEIDVLDGVVLERFVVREGSNRRHATAVAVEYSGHWSTTLLEGLWFALPSDDDVVLVGVRNKMNRIQGFRIHHGE
jgi:hypothetical protein